MVINPNQYEDLDGLLTELINPQFGGTEEATTVISYCEDLLIDDVTETIVESRAPKLYTIGRSGAGKSSLVNALANKQVTDIGEVEPTTAASNAYDITFPDRSATWKIVDSRGLFESVPADGGAAVDTVEMLKSNLNVYNPDILLHVVTPEQVRAGEDDLAVIKDVDDAVVGGLPPRVMCLNKIDTYLSPGGDWPPEQNPAVEQRITELLALVEDILSIPESNDIDEITPARGRLFDSEDVFAAVPTYLKARPFWNVTTVAELLCNYLPAEALLQFAQAQRRERLMRQLARKQTIAVANAVNEIPRKLIVNPNIPIISGFEAYLIALIGSFAGRELSVDLVDEYLDTRNMPLNNVLSELSDITVDSVTGLLKDDLDYLPKSTYAVGRAAEEYFFDDEVIAESEFLAEAEEVL
ncbi:GTPase [Haloglomus halophilum]|uniref:GTPase n=1 Tax=Haloglomus halophilum TaxID=2962672 RepID=UPI0020C9AACC|nr:GTPase [Haloglomus halophilum]